LTYEYNPDEYLNELIAYRANVRINHYGWDEIERKLTDIYERSPQKENQPDHAFSEKIKAAIETVQKMDERLGFAPTTHSLLHTTDLDDLLANYGRSALPWWYKPK
jgi:hypothetical protein